MKPATDTPAADTHPVAWSGSPPPRNEPLSLLQRVGFSVTIAAMGLLGLSILMVYGNQHDKLGLFVWTGTITGVVAWTASTSRPSPRAPLLLVLTYFGLVTTAIFGQLVRVRDYQSYGMGEPGGCMVAPDSYQAFVMSGTLWETPFGDFGARHEVLFMPPVLLLPILLCALLIHRWVRRPFREQRRAELARTTPQVF